MKLKTLAFKLDIKALDEQGMFTGYASTFGNVDHHGDVVMPGAFAKSLAEHAEAGTMPAMLWQHDPWNPVGVYESMKEDEEGLLVTGRLAIGTTQGRDAYELMKMKALTGLSIGYRVRAYDRDAQSEITKLTDIDLREVSLVTFPANDFSRIDVVKNTTRCETIRELETLLRDAGGFSKAEAKAIAAGGWAGLKRRDADEASQKEINEAAKQLLETLKL